MKAYMCDRCGSLYVLQPEISHVRFSGANVPVRRMGFINEQNNPVVPDLCAKCFDSFIEWWNEPGLETIVNEGD